MLLKNPSLVVYLLFPASAAKLKQCLESVFSVFGDKAFVCRVGNVAQHTGEASGTDLIAACILSTGLSVLRKSIGIV